MNCIPLFVVAFFTIFVTGVSQLIRVVEVSQPVNPRNVRNFNTNGGNSLRQVQNDGQTVIFEFLKPRGLGIYIPGPYPPSFQYKLKFHININKQFEGWKAADWNEGVIIRNGGQWKYTFPQIQVKKGDTIYYWIEAEGADWEKGYRGKYEITQSLTQGTQPQDRLQDSSSCMLKSVTTYTGMQEACAGEQMIRSYFRIAPKYMREGSEYFMESMKQIGGFQPEESFTVFSKRNIVWNDTHNVFVPSLLDDTYGPNTVDSTNFTLRDCNAPSPELCSAGATAYLILPPVMSGRHSTENSFSFRYGVVEVTAKLPKGDWIVPELWLMPKNRVYGNSSGKIVLAMSRGNLELSDDIQDYSSRVLEAGVQMNSGDQMFRKVSYKPWSSDYHKFKLIWTPDKMEFLVDGEVIGRIEPGEEGLDPSLHGSKMAPFDQEFYLVFGVHVGGDRDFPDSVYNKPWNNYEPKNKLKFWRARQNWYNTWGVESSLYIRGLSVTALVP